jgi:hypothetical protein
MVRQVSQTTVVDWSLCNSILDKSIKPPKASADTGLGEEMKFAVRATMLSSSRQGIEYRFPNRRSPSSRSSTIELTKPRCGAHFGERPQQM